jgi:hypothetical protein
MNQAYFGQVIVAPDADGFGVVAFSDQQRRVWADPLRFASAMAVLAGWGPIVEGDYVCCASATPQWQVTWRTKKGAPTYVFEGA